MAALGEQKAVASRTPFFSQVYRVFTTEKAESLLRAWLGLSPYEETPEWPKAVPVDGSLAEMIRLWLRWQLSSHGIAAAHKVWTDRLAEPVRFIVAAEIAAYLLEQSPDLVDDWPERLATALDLPTREAIEHQRRPSDPGLPPSDPASVGRWYRERYIGWRLSTRTSTDLATQSRVSEITRCFAEWYLEMLPRWLAGGSDEGALAWVRAHRLSTDVQAAAFVTLLVVLDGVGPRDVEELLRLLRQRTSRLTVSAADHAFALIPTVTTFTKPSLLPAHRRPGSTTQFP